MIERLQNIGAVLRYNLQILAANLWWTLVGPLVLAVITFIPLFLERQEFRPSQAAGLAEGLMPIIGAFICAHALDAELRRQADEVLRAKRKPFWRTLLLRLTLGLLVTFGFGLAALGIARIALGEFVLWKLFLAGVPSTLFLAMVGLIVALLVRNAILSMILPLMYWLMDYGLGWYFNPLLVLSSYKFYLWEAEGVMAPLTEAADWDWWWISKIALGVVAAGLFVAIMRQVGRTSS